MLGEDDQRRLGVIADWKDGPHHLTYRQTERTFGLVAGALAGRPAACPRSRCRRSATACWRHPFPASSKTPAPRTGRRLDGPGVLLPAPAREGRPLRRPRGVLGTPQEQPAARRERAVLRLLLLRRHHDARRARARRPRVRPPRHGIVLPARPGPRVPARADLAARPGDPARRSALRLRLRAPRRRAWALPARAAGAQLVQDLHPHDRGPKGTHHGAIIANGNLYCPKTPRTLTELGPLARTATREQAADWERSTAELARYKLGRITRDDPDGYHRVQCPAAMGKIRCPLRPQSMTLDRPARDPHPARAPPGLLHPADPHRPARGQR